MKPAGPVKIGAALILALGVLTINLWTAKAIRLTVPQSLLARADRVIDP